MVGQLSGAARPASPFFVLFEACLLCGRFEAVEPCDSCGGHLPGADPELALLGARVEPASSQRRETVIAVGPVDVEVVTDDGSVSTVPRYSLALDEARLAPAAPASHQLLRAVTYWQLPPAAAAVVVERAIELARQGTDTERLRFAELAHLAGHEHAVRQLGLAEPTTTWFEGLRLAVDGDYQGASWKLLELPEGRFPGCLGIWNLAADEMTEKLRTSVRDRLASYHGANQDQDRAALAVEYGLAQAESPGGTANGVRRRYEQLGPWPVEAAHAEASTRAGRLARLAELVDHDPHRLAEEPALISDAPRQLVDDLIDDGLLDRTVAAAIPQTGAGAYAVARLDPSHLDDAAVASHGPPTEQARRALLRGEPLPAGLPKDVAERYHAVAQLFDGELFAETIIAALGSDLAPDQLDELEHALASPETVPAEDLLDTELAGSLLAEHSVGHLSIDGLQRSDLGPAQGRLVGSVCLARSRDALFEWRSDDAIKHAKDCLRLCADLDIRSEALNLIAAATWVQGDDSAALGALESALASSGSFPLRANMAVAAREVEPDRAATHLAHLIDEAPDLATRVAAARMALEVWHTNTVPTEQDDALPDTMALALRDLLTEPIPVDDFRDFARLLADHDASWMATFDQRTDAPHAASAAGQLYAARARGSDDFIPTLAYLVSADPTAAWLQEERDRLVYAVIDALAAPEPLLGAVPVAELMVEHHLQMDPADWVVVRALTARAVGTALADDVEGEPAIRFLEWLERDAASVSQVGPDDRDRVAKAMEFGFTCLAVAYLRNRSQQLHQAADYHDEILGQIAHLPPRRRNQTAIWEATRAIEEVARDSKHLLRRLLRHVTGELAEHLEETVGLCDQLLDGVQNLRRM